MCDGWQRLCDVRYEDLCSHVICRVGQNHTYLRIYGIVSRKITIHMVIYGVYIRFWSALITCIHCANIVHTLCIHCACTVHALCIHCASCIPCACIVHALCIIVHTSCIHRASTSKMKQWERMASNPSHSVKVAFGTTRIMGSSFLQKSHANRYHERPKHGRGSNQLVRYANHICRRYT